MNPIIVNDVTGLNPIKVGAVFAPSTVDQLKQFVNSTDGPLSIGGGRFSMGGQIASEGSLHIDMRGLNQIINFDKENRRLRVQSGIRWLDIQKVIDAHGLAVRIMQTYSDFTVGGSISVNCHGRYIGLGPLILSIRSILVMFHDGEMAEAGPEINPEVFYSVVGGYGALGVIVEAEIELTENTRVEQIRKKLETVNYLQYFKEYIRGNEDAVFHNADLYPPNYQRASAVTWFKTDKPVTTKERLNPRRRLYLIEKYLLWAITETPFGKWRREYIIDPVIYSKRRVHWRNYEAGYDVNELEPLIRDERTYVLQEYFVPIEKFLDFVNRSSEILRRHRVNVVNISVRHAHTDPESYLAWAREEVFAFVLYYKQRTRMNAKHRVAVWTRELIDAVLEFNGAYYLPYQPHATKEQFIRAYPNAKKLFADKRRYDPNYRFRNSLWNKYYNDDRGTTENVKAEKGGERMEFIHIYKNTVLRDKFYLFLQNIYRIYPEDRFHALIIEACDQYYNDLDIYDYICRNLPSIKPFLSELTYALPALSKQKIEITRQTGEILGGNSALNGYLEIGSLGRYVRHLRAAKLIKGPIYLTNDVPPGFSPPDIMERGQLTRIGRFFEFDDYAPISQQTIKDNSLGLVSCYIGLHHCLPELLEEYVKSIHRVLSDSGVLILRDHDAGSADMRIFVSLVHTVFNAGLGVSWDTNQKEERHFTGVDFWVEVLEKNGFKDTGKRILQDNDPSLNTLMAFEKA